MLKFIRNLLAKKEIPEEKIELNELNSWLDTKAKPILDGLNIKINEIIEKINNDKIKASENLKILEHAQLQNPKIPERVKTIMEGNRFSFIKRVSLLFNNLDLKYNDFEELTEKCKNIQNEIDEVGKSTARNYQILNEFFAREAEKVAMNIKNIEDYSKELVNIVDNSKILDIDKIKDNIIGLKNKIKLKESYTIQLGINEKNLNDGKNKKIDIEKKINELKSSTDYRNYEKLVEETGKIEIKIKEIENTLFHDLSALERAMKKYAKISFENEEFILEYLDSPIIALIKDADFKISVILDNLKNSIERNELGLEDKKKDKSIDKINEMDSVYLTKLKDDFMNARKSLNELTEEIESNNSRKNMDSLNTELMNINQNIESINNEIVNLNGELGKINIEKLKENLQNGINKTINAKVALL